MNHHTRPAEPRRVLTRHRLRPALTASAALLMLVTACGGQSSPGAAPGSAGSAGGSGSHGSNSVAGPGTETPAAGKRSATTGGALFGGNAALASQQGNLGRRLAIIRAYYHVGEPFPAPL